jgi:hypothetical protein
VPALLDILRSLDEYDRERAAYLKGKNMTEPVHKQGVSLVGRLEARAYALAAEYRGGTTATHTPDDRTINLLREAARSISDGASERAELHESLAFEREVSGLRRDDAVKFLSEKRKYADALLAIREHIQGQTSPQALSILATCDNALAGLDLPPNPIEAYAEQLEQALRGLLTFCDATTDAQYLKVVAARKLVAKTRNEISQSQEKPR